MLKLKEIFKIYKFKSEKKIKNNETRQKLRYSYKESLCKFIYLPRKDCYACLRKHCPSNLVPVLIS